LHLAAATLLEAEGANGDMVLGAARRRSVRFRV